MLKNIDHLFHFTEKYDTIIDIFKNGFKPSYANEQLGKQDIKVAMISFSNVLLRDVGDEEVFNYGPYALCLTRDWGIKNQVNPVLYTYDEGNLESSINILLENSLFLKYITNFNETIEKYSKQKGDPISKYMDLSGTSKEAKDVLDYLSVKYDEDLIQIISRLSNKTLDTNFNIVKITKAYKVKDKEGKEFIAYNDREWRKVYDNLPFLMEGSPEFEEWDKKNKPHFEKDPYLLKFELGNLRAVMVETEEKVHDVISFLKGHYGEHEIISLLDKGDLYIGTQKMLEKNNF